MSPESLAQGQEVDLTLEKPASGGRMIARHARQVVLVLGGIPGERVRARMTRTERQLAFAETIEVLQPSADRRAPASDLLCGGCLYAHIAYSRQVALKGEVIQDAFVRLGHIPIAEPIAVMPSPESAYRMRARLHVQGRRLGFYREGTHDLCDAGQTRQLTRAGIAAAGVAVSLLADAGHMAGSLELAENIEADQRVIHLSLVSGNLPPETTLQQVLAASGLTGCSVTRPAGAARSAGVPYVSDSLPVLTRGRAESGVLVRHAESFFQANRFLVPYLVEAVLDSVPTGGEVLDLYAGVGLFSVALAACGRAGITGVEGDRSAARDLLRNAGPFASRLRVVRGSVEEYLGRARGRRASTVIVDPPRTGMSRAALEAVVATRALRLVYVSCDPPTMARDARRLLDAGYRLRSLQAFDLFPNTPHVETLGAFDRDVRD